MEEQNVGTLGQEVRMVSGSLASLSGIVLLVPGKASLLSGAAGVLLVIAGLYLFATGYTGYCPIYRRLGRDTLNVRVRDNDPSINRCRSHRGASEGRKILPMLLWCLSVTAAIVWIVHEVWGA